MAKKPEPAAVVGDVKALAKRAAAAVEKLRVKPGAKLDLAAIDPESKLGFEKEEAEALIESNRARMAELHELLWADNSRALLLIMQGMDTSGKDGVIRHVMTGLNPQGCHVASFKVPTEEEADHDYLWRVHKQVPAKGEIGIFNRSHYEAVLAERVLGIVPEKTWKRRYAEINAFESLLENSGTHVVKLFLHISKDEQKERLQARLDDPIKNWKFSPGDLDTRAKWDAYRAAFEEALTKCSTAEAPWYVIPSNRKWVRNLCASTVVLAELESMGLKWPKPKFDLSKVKIV